MTLYRQWLEYSLPGNSMPYDVYVALRGVK